MRDFGLLITLVSLVGLALWRPWLGVIALAFFDYLQPHAFSTEFMRDVPVYRILFAATLVGVWFTRERQWPPRDWRVPALLLFWSGLLVTTWQAYFPALAWPRLVEVSAVLASTFLILILVDDRRKLFWLLAGIATAFALVAVKGAYWALLQGFSERVYGPPGGQYYDNNHFAVAAVMTLPLLGLWMQESHRRPLKLVLGIAMAAGVLAALSSWSRGGLLTLGVTLHLMMLAHGRRLLVLIPLVVAVAVAVWWLPEAWFARMESIGTLAQDASVRGRFEAWTKGLGFAWGRPFLGGGFEAWTFGLPTLDWHNAYIEVMAEHGLVMFALWIGLIIGTLISLTGLVWRRHAVAPWVVSFSFALRASLAAYCVGAVSLGIAYWAVLYHLIAAAIVLRALARPADSSRVVDPWAVRWTCRAAWPLGKKTRQPRPQVA